MNRFFFLNANYLIIHLLQVAAALEDPNVSSYYILTLIYCTICFIFYDFNSPRFSLHVCKINRRFNETDCQYVERLINFSSFFFKQQQQHKDTPKKMFFPQSCLHEKRKSYFT